MLLSVRHRRFCEEYLKDLNGSQAVIRAGYAASCAAQTAHRLLRNADIQAKIAALKEERSQLTRLTNAEIVDEVDLLASSDIGEVMDFSGDFPKMRKANEIPTRARKAIQSLKIRVVRTAGGRAQGYVLDLKMAPKIDALRLSAEHRGLIRHRTENLDLSKLNDEQLERYANGEDIVHILLTSTSPGPT